MALSQRLEIRQSQALVMTPQLMQAIKLLQLSSLDLAAYVDGELERNPLLERTVEGDGDHPAAEQAPADDHESGGNETAADWYKQDLETSRTAIEQRLDTDLENVFPDEPADAPARPSASEPVGYSEWSSVGTGGHDGDYNLEAFVSTETTLAGQLAEQLALSIAAPARRMIGQHPIDLVDEAGYLTGDCAAVADKLGAAVAEVEDVLAVLQGFDPPGICARNLAECLAIQLRERNRF